MIKPVRRDRLKNASVFGTWTIAATIGIFAILIIILAVITLGSPSGKTTAADPRACSEKVIAYINTNLASPGQTATLVNITENNDIYTIWSRYQGRRPADIRKQGLHASLHDGNRL